MAKEITTNILIKASPEKIWHILMDTKSYPQWNPFIVSMEGDLMVNHKIKAKIQPPGASAMTFKPTLLVVEPNKELRWLGHLLIPRLFDGEHKFELADNENGTTTFTQSEKFTGILVPLFKKMLDNNTIAGFNLMNEKLKERAEAVKT